MHSFLIIGKDEVLKEKKVSEIIKNLGAKRLDFNFQKIEDARNLGSFIKLKATSKTAIVLKNVDNATNEALSAFLKNLEEPQENIIYITTATFFNKIIPTIISRCQIIKVNGEVKRKSQKKYENFLEGTTGSRMKTISNIKKREEAKNFIEEIILTSYQKLIKSPNIELVKISEEAQKCYLALEKNANVTLSLTRFVAEVD